MRIKDENKRIAIIEETLNLVYKEGFASLKMSVLAKRVGLSVSTLYVYFNSKEDLIEKTYQELIVRFSKQTRGAINDDLPFNLKLKSIWVYWINYILSNTKEFSFFKQLKQSPYGKIHSVEAMQLNNKIVFELFEIGKKEGILKDLPNEQLAEVMKAMLRHVVSLISMRKMNLNQEEIDLWYSLMWDAIKK